jgi:hypothetical protein
MTASQFSPAFARGTRRAAHGEQHYRAQLTEADVCQIRAEPWVSVVEFARRLGVWCSTVSRVRTGRTWRHVVCPPSEAESRCPSCPSTQEYGS